MTVYRCDWCGRFYSSSLPEGSACRNHILEHNARLAESIKRHNEKWGWVRDSVTGKWSQRQVAG